MLYCVYAFLIQRPSAHYCYFNLSLTFLHAKPSYNLQHPWVHNILLALQETYCIQYKLQQMLHQFTCNLYVCRAGSILIGTSTCGKGSAEVVQIVLFAINALSAMTTPENDIYIL